MKFFVYSGKHYGAEHRLVSVANNVYRDTVIRASSLLTLVHEPSGDLVQALKCDCEEIPASLPMEVA